MTSGTIWLIAVLVGIGFVVGIVVRWWLHRQKVAAFTALAGQRGWVYRERDKSLVNRYEGTPFGKGFGKDARHVLAGGHRGREFVAFEYLYKEQDGSGDNRRTTTYRNTVVALDTPASRPTLEVSREGFGRKLLGLVGVRDLQLESEEFNKTFLIRCENERFAYDVLHPRTMEWMLADQRAVELPFRFERADLLSWRRGAIDPTAAQWMLDYLCDVLERVPEFVWKS